MPKSIHRLTSVIKSIRDEMDIRRIELGDADDWPLPAFTPGAHVDVFLPSGKVRQYSLCGDPKEEQRYHLAVKRETGGRGGSAEAHEKLQVGQEILLSLPRNHLPLVNSAGRVIMVAGGIGITPFLSMLPVLRRSGADYRLHYATPAPDQTPLRDRLKPYGKNIRFHHSSTKTRLKLTDVVSDMGDADHLYVCGPISMLAEAETLGAHLGKRLHIEYFGAATAAGDPAYEVRIASTGQIIAVPEGHSMLEALRIAGVDIPASCEGGVCLDCKTRYLSGIPVHRELTMAKAERSEYLTPCVSGCEGGRITLDL